MTIRTLIASVCFLAASSPILPVLHAQTAQPCLQSGANHTSCGLKVNPAASRPLLSPFSLDSSSTSVTKLHSRALGQMSASDRALLDQATPRIAARAASQGFHLDGQKSGQGTEAAFAGWNLRQIECGPLPDFLLMSYVRDAKTNREASFTVAIPRTASGGRLHLVPVERRGYSLYTPSSRNAMTIVVFNDLLREDAHAAQNDWFGLGLCYAALAGFRVQAVTALEPSTGDPVPAYMPASLSVSWKQPPSIAFVGLSPAASRPMQWTLLFDRTGSLRKVRTKKAGRLAALPAKAGAVDLK